MDYMKKVLKDVPGAAYTMPDGMVAARINDSGQPDANGERVEYFYQENLSQGQLTASPEKSQREAVKDQLF